MQNKINKILLFSIFSLLLIRPSYGDTSFWNYYGSGRDHPYSAYIDRANYVGPADYATIQPDYIDGPLVINKMAVPTITPTPPPAAPVTLPEYFTINIPNSRGGYNSVIIKKSGDGYIGPNGEFYPEFPKIFQLQMKYGN